MDANWKLLPHDPRGFFGLGDTFERKELKRAYNVFLKQYKPEKFPEEFKRLRAAYEALDRELRYGQAATVQTLRQEYEWTQITSKATTDAQTNAADSSENSVVESEAFHQRLKQESPAVIYKELLNRQNKTPYEYFTLALTADVVTEKPLLFYQWIATGLKDHPEDRGLLNLLKEYFETPIDVTFLPKILIATSKIVTTDRFYFLTESCWQQLLSKADFRVFQSTLHQCESNLKLFDDRGKHAFYSHILKHAIWKANDQWLEGVFNFLNHNTSGLNPNSDYTLYLLEKMRDFRSKSEKIVGSNPIRQKIRDTIVEYYSNDTEIGDRLVLECQLDFGDSPDAILRAFPPDLLQKDDSGAESMWAIWNAISEEVLERNGLTPPDVNPSKFMSRLHRLMKDLDSTWEFSSFKVIAFRAMSVFLYLLFAALPFILFGSWLFELTASRLATPFMMLGGIALFHFWLRPKTITPIFIKMIQASIRRHYHTLWRGRFVQFFEATQATMVDMNNGLMQIVSSDQTELTAATHLVIFVPNDLGLAFYSQAVRFRT